MASVEPSSQDIVVLNHVLEHLPDPRGTLRRVREWLKPDGFLLIGLPNFASPIARLTRENWAGLVPIQHVWHVTLPALARMVAEVGFTQLRWRAQMLTDAPRGVTGRVAWAVRRTLEPMGLADNLLVARRGVVEPSA